MAERVGVSWISVPFALMLSFSIAGIGSAWMGGSARIPFVAGLDSYMPSWLGKVHPRYATPYAALIVQAIVSGLLVLGNFFGWWFWDKLMGFARLAARLYLSPAGAGEVFQKLLSLAVVLQLVPFVYMFGALVKFGVKESTPKGQYGRVTMLLAGFSGFLTTILRNRTGVFPGPADHVNLVL